MPQSQSPSSSGFLCRRTVEADRLSQGLEPGRGRAFRLRRHADRTRRKRVGHQRRRQHHRDRRASRKQRRQGHQRQPERPFRLQLRRRVRVHTPGRDRDPAGLHQGVEPRRRRQFRVQRRLEPRRQHHGGRRLLRVQRRHRHQRQPERSLDPGGRRRLRLHAHRHHLVAAGLHQGLEHGPGRGRRRFRRRRPVRLLHRVELRRQHAGGGRDRRGQRRHRHQRRPGRQHRRIKPAPRTSSPGPAAPGRSRRTSSRR